MGFLPARPLSARWRPVGAEGIEQDRIYRYEATDRSFAADLVVDEDGLVVDYPGLFGRVQI